MNYTITLEKSDLIKIQTSLLYCIKHAFCECSRCQNKKNELKEVFSTIEFQFCKIDSMK